jgi:hypothetical protein
MRPGAAAARGRRPDMKPFCYVCRKVRDDLLKLPVGGSAVFLDGIRRAIPSGLWVCPEHTPISYLEERPPQARKGAA